jgi:primosomal protein N' (replication factor Y)
VAGDYPAFAAEELDARAKTDLPPVWRMARIVLADQTDSKVESESQRLAEIIKDAVVTAGANVRCDGPERCAIQRQRQLYRYELVLRAPTADAMQRVLDQIRGKTLLAIRVKRLTVDVDPMSFA